MYRKDQIKGIIALILFAAIGLSYFLFGNGPLTKGVTIAAVCLWFLSLYFLNKSKKD